jgi:hypothetical protein
VRQVNHRAVLVVNHLSVYQHHSLPLMVVQVVAVANFVQERVAQVVLHLSVAHLVPLM